MSTEPSTVKVAAWPADFYCKVAGTMLQRMHNFRCTVVSQQVAAEEGLMGHESRRQPPGGEVLHGPDYGRCGRCHRGELPGWFFDQLGGYGAETAAPLLKRGARSCS